MALRRAAEVKATWSSDIMVSVPLICADSKCFARLDVLWYAFQTASWFQDLKD